MASGHVNRANRPNTWRHRPSLQREERQNHCAVVLVLHQARARDGLGRQGCSSRGRPTSLQRSSSPLRMLTSRPTAVKSRRVAEPKIPEGALAEGGGGLRGIIWLVSLGGGLGGAPGR